MFSALQKVKSTEDGPLGPGSDLLAALLGTFVLLAVSEKEGLGVRSNQMQMIQHVAQEFRARVDTQPEQTFRLFGGYIGKDTVKIQNDATVQHFYFGGNILFDPRQDSLKTDGEKIVHRLGKVIHDNLSSLDEIQIQGHADNVNTDYFNLDLASRRAMSVFWSFKNDCQINPHEHLMSVTSFGEYKPVDRKKQDWNITETNNANNSPMKLDRNRRIEIILFYKTTMDP